MKLIWSDSKDIYIVTKKSYFQINAFLLKYIYQRILKKWFAQIYCDNNGDNDKKCFLSKSS